MSDWVIIAAVLAATTGVSIVFWLVVMPRLALSSASTPARAGAIIAFGLVLVAIPVLGWLSLGQRTVALICALIIGWGMAVRASGWFAARKFFVPRLKAIQREEQESRAVKSEPPP